MPVLPAHPTRPSKSLTHKPQRRAHAFAEGRSVPLLRCLPCFSQFSPLMPSFHTVNSLLSSFLVPKLRSCPGSDLSSEYGQSQVKTFDGHRGLRGHSQDMASLTCTMHPRRSQIVLLHSCWTPLPQLLHALQLSRHPESALMPCSLEQPAAWGQGQWGHPHM